MVRADEVPMNHGKKSTNAEAQTLCLQNMMQSVTIAVSPVPVPNNWKDHFGRRRLNWAATKLIQIVEANIADNTNQSRATNGKMAGPAITSSELRQ